MSELENEKVENTTEQEEPKTENIQNEVVEEQQVESKEAELTAKLAEMQDRYLRLSAEFDNYRRRTLKEKMDLNKTAGEEIFVSLLPIVDDFERALSSMNDAKDISSVKDGVSLIYNKIIALLTQKGIKVMDALNADFDADFHEAITKIPVDKKKNKGKVMDVVSKGYMLDEKVIRYAKCPVLVITPHKSRK